MLTISSAAGKGESSTTPLLVHPGCCKPSAVFVPITLATVHPSLSRNELFVKVKVDREERPDVDKVYMTYVQATQGGGGWPMSCFLTPT